jgi:hypothetical protein
MTEFITWCQKSALSEAIRSQPWPYPTIEIFHLAGLILVFGSILVLNLRIFGRVLREEPVWEVAGGLARFTWIGLAVQAVSGPLMFMTSANRFYDSSAFRLKLLLLVVALVYHFGVHRRLAFSNGASTGILRTSATLSLALWGGTVLAGLAIELIS